ncbi:phosphatase [Xanthomonas arboricola pv. fragariae]|nr:phosphatase [Xanthomonas arboricola pv. fragariae]
MPIFDPARRQVLKGSAAVMAAGALGSLSALQSRQAQAANSSSPPLQLAPVPSRYGPLASGRRPEHRTAAAAAAARFQLPLVRLERRPHGRWPALPRPP